MTSIFLAFALLTISSSDVSGTQSNANNEAPAAVEANSIKKEKKICKSVVSTGSRIGRKKICLTAAKWEQQGY